MPKERFHLYLADEVLNRCEGGLPPDEIHGPLNHPRGLALYIGAISPDIFFYDLPSFSLSPLGNALHDLMDSEGISIIYDWIAKTCSPLAADQAGKVLWALGFACHFLADAAWHPVIEELSGCESLLRKDAPKGQGASKPFSSGIPLLSTCHFCSEIECHRLLEAELEALWLARSPAPEKYDNLLMAFTRDRGLLFEIASYYRRFLEFAGLSSGISEKRIVKCCLYQNFLLRLFANRMLGRQRDRLFSLPPTRSLGALVTPLRPVLPTLFSGIFPQDRNPFSDYFLEQALTTLKLSLCGLAERLSQYLPN